MVSAAPTPTQERPGPMYRGHHSLISDCNAPKPGSPITSAALILEINFIIYILMTTSDCLTGNSKLWFELECGESL